MTPQAKQDELRRKTNPVFNDRKLKLGTFGTNLDRGCAISTIDGVLELNWPNTLTLAKLADRNMQLNCTVQEGQLWLANAAESVLVEPVVLKDATKAPR
mgnify:CR=1 FL=1